MFGVGCWFLLLVGVFLLWFFLSCCVSFLASAPYAPSYISYDVSSHSEWALDFLLGCSTTGVAFFDSLVAKDCQYPRDPMQPAIKKKKSVQERYILCRHDRPLRSPGTNKGRISQWW